MPFVEALGTVAAVAVLFAAYGLATRGRRSGAAGCGWCGTVRGRLSAAARRLDGVEAGTGDLPPSRPSEKRTNGDPKLAEASGPARSARGEDADRRMRGGACC